MKKKQILTIILIMIVSIFNIQTVTAANKKYTCTYKTLVEGENYWEQYDKENIKYEENNSIDDMFRLGIDTVPVLGVDGELYSFKEAKKIIKNLNGGICR